jgi:23S rRNA-/tRNA-specific pseudouridylate synthase
LNDPLYGKAPGQEQALGAYLALRAQALFFADPQSGEKREYRLKNPAFPGTNNYGN